MRRERLFLLVSLAANVLLFAGLLYALNELARARVVGAKERQQSDRLWQRVSELESAAKSRAATQPAVTDTEVLELARLRNEVTRLRTEQRASALTNSAAARRPPAPAPALTPPPSQPVTKLSSTVSAQVQLGHALALGGWAGAEPGQRIVGVIAPSADASSHGQVLLETQLLTIPDRLLDRLGLQDLRTDQVGSQSAAGLDPARLAALLKLAEQEAGVSILSSPQVLTGSGRAARVARTNRGRPRARPTDSGPSRPATWRFSRRPGPPG